MAINRRSRIIIVLFYNGKRAVAAREANQQFSALLAAAEREGEGIIITRQGIPVDRLIPEPAQTQAAETDWLVAFSWPIGGGWFSRAELYTLGDHTSLPRSTSTFSSARSIGTKIPFYIGEIAGNWDIETSARSCNFCRKSR